MPNGGTCIIDVYKRLIVATFLVRGSHSSSAAALSDFNSYRPPRKSLSELAVSSTMANIVTSIQPKGLGGYCTCITVNGVESKPMSQLLLLKFGFMTYIMRELDSMRNQITEKKGRLVTGHLDPGILYIQQNDLKRSNNNGDLALAMIIVT
jgi:hypothetical protein